jgi:hypothetical protein
MRYHLAFIAVALPALAVLTGCAGMSRYLDEHSSDHASQSFPYTQIGRVEFYGPFDVAIFQANQAWPATPEDSKAVQDSYATPVVQPVLVNGALVYPAIPQQKRVVRIAHHIRGLADEVPPPSWNGPVIHETTRVPWSGDEQARYDNEWRYERHHETKRNDRPDAITPQPGDNP